MSEKDINDLAVFPGALANCAAPVKISFIKALDNLLGGLTAIPAAKLKQYAQGIEDTTASRSAIAAAIAKACAESAVADPVLMQAATEVFLPSSIRKARNRLNVAMKAAEYIAADTGDSSKSTPPDEDWINLYTRFAEDASSEKLQDLFGRILAGQIVRPGSFSASTIRALAELDQSIAIDFDLVWTKSVGDSVDYSSEFQRGEWFSRWQRLAEAGLMSSRHIAQFLPPFTPIIDGNGVWTPVNADDTFLIIKFTQNYHAEWLQIEFTRTGREIGSILARPNYAENMRLVGRKLVQQGVSRVELHAGGKLLELIYEAAAPQSG